MGRGKSITGIGTFDFYTKDIDLFIKQVSQKFEVNIDVSISNLSRHEPKLPEEGIVDMGYEETYSLFLNFFDLDENNFSEDFYITYSLTAPIVFEYEENLTIEFFPNEIFEISFLTFESTWNFFIASIRGEYDYYYTSHQEVINKYNTLRKLYKTLLSKLNCIELLIYGDYEYGFANLLIYPSLHQKKITFKKILSLAKKIDHLMVFELCKLLGSNTALSTKKFAEAEPFKIILIDRMDC